MKKTLKINLIDYILCFQKKYDLFYIPFLLEGVALNPELNLSDGMHPNEKGVNIISKTLLKKIKKIRLLKLNLFIIIFIF